MTSLIVEPAREPLRGTVRAPGDKSIAHRALLFAALSTGTSRITGLSGGEDNHRTAVAMSQLGADVRFDEGAAVVTGVGPDGLRAPGSALDMGNSGTGMRLLAGLLAGQTFRSELVGDESLSGRPMGRITRPLSAMGARIEGRPGARDGDVVPPLRITGRPLQGITYELPVASAQVKSAVLLAGLFANGVTETREPGPSRDHTERMLLHLGVPLERPQKHVVRLDPSRWDRRLELGDVEVPGDPSSVAFLVAAAVVTGSTDVRIDNVCVNDTRTGFLDALALMGARIERVNLRDMGGEPVADLVVRSAADLVGVPLGGDLVVRAIDELPVLAVVAAHAQGTTTVTDAAELRVKESDRIATTCAMLRAFGVPVQERADGFTVEGGHPLAGARVDSAGDHRIAMAAAVAALTATGPTRIDDTDNVATSFPSFAATVGALGAELRTMAPR